MGVFKGVFRLKSYLELLLIFLSGSGALIFYKKCDPGERVSEVDKSGCLS